MPMRDFDYDLPVTAVAQTPVEPRDAARLLVALAERPPAHHRVADLAAFVRAGDVLVVNETRVLPARLRLRKTTGGVVEVLLLEPLEAGGGWEALVRPSRRVQPGTILEAGSRLKVEIAEALDGGRRRVVLHADGDELAALAEVGTVPLPPYITAPLADPERYQTVFAAQPRSTAAPTAGLHLTEAVLDACRAARATVAPVELQIGLDTFRPVTVEDPAEHVMHSERYRVPPETMEACERAGRVVAVGTTAVRALESAAATGALEGRTRLFIQGAFEFRLVDVLLTNFHLPRSSLLLLLDAFAGPGWRELYRVALDEGYRFLSFGDAMLVERGALR